MFNDTLQTYRDAFDLEALKSILLFDERNPLLFNTSLFLLLFVGFLAVYSVLRRWRNAKLLFVILFSLYFYYKSSAYYCFILLGVCLSDYFIGLMMGWAEKRWVKRLLVVANVVLNIGMLVYFKYFNMILETFANINNTSFDPLDIVLPAGISFFCFRSISYIVDIYRGDMEPAHNFLEYTFFLTFFPPLLAGPVVRARDMMPQIRANNPATHAMVSEGLVLIMAGLIKKVIIADYISGGFVDRVFENPGLYSGFENLLGCLGWGLQIYCDFSGYSDMAIGLALLLGYRFKDNFRAPYKSKNPSEFWHRWHISLSTWLRDYVYIPLGGNRKGKLRTHANLMSTMVIGGLWHGASWMYVIWGAYNGFLLVMHRILRKVHLVPEKVRGSWWVNFSNIVITFTLVLVGMVVLRSVSMDSLQTMQHQIFHDFRPEVIPAFVDGYMMIVVAIVTGYVLHFMPSAWNGRTYRTFARLPFIVQGVILAAVIFLTIQVSQSDLVPFIYLQY